MQNNNKKKQAHFWPIMALYFLVIGSALLLFSTKPNKLNIRNFYQAEKVGSNIVVLLNNNELLGNYLVDKAGMTLYTFKNDVPNQSQCLGDCIKNWPPLLNEPDMALGLGLAGVLGVIERSDGDVQLTYNGQALYHYIKDKNMGDTFGQGINKLWYVATP